MPNEKNDHPAPISLDYRSSGPRTSLHPDALRRRRAIRQAYTFGASAALAWLLVILRCGGVLRGADVDIPHVLWWLVLIAIAVVLSVLAVLRWATITSPE